MIAMIAEYIKQAKEWVLEQVLWAERELRGKSGAEKKAAVVKRLDDMITLPAWLEWADGPVIGWLVDSACDTLNGMYGHAWGAAVFHRKELERTANAMPDPDENAGAETAPDAGAKEEEEEEEEEEDADAGAEED